MFRFPPPLGLLRTWFGATGGVDAGRGCDRSGDVGGVGAARHRHRPAGARRSQRWFNLLWLLPIGFVLLIVAVAVAKGLRGDPSVQRFIARYPGTVASSHPDATTGFPVWVRWQHFFNLFLWCSSSVPGVQILSDHPRLYWTRHSTPGRDWFRIQKPVPADPLWTAKQDSISLPGQVGLPGLRHSIGLARWWHLGHRRAVAAQRRRSSTSCCSRPVGGSGWYRPAGTCFPTRCRS